ncbi:SDR family NAD(P)-dependent oxidoreductase [Frankia sp. AgB1.9]|uniref:SDR family NAD(P)-dependent oxidoreductase n=1 Tax=unclassified Frankia TaxID=2632575 RepID=UPI001933617B|nr:MULTISPECIES: SDR family NAD(P)-dependent oxidoreductase [unclassified Frankia]MBL7492474.1 SDR family NAD(P)-dependent oxidoreductase [Frankia sp. AgW1.1]MBL7547074.1 SDR family NAD(P)-dependent oxidoreductase [Frankia sp. AgB1.9]MBL7619365.1 SDR family NAD(P)-dependent oxidoreductase [Frankia sp. AgB1.8]
MAILITGATDGLGRALAQRLAADGETLILHGRDTARLQRTADEIEAGPGAKRPATVLADLSELAQVRRLAAEVRGMTDRLDVLVSNAGIGSGEPTGRERGVSADGYELRFAVNYLAGFLLTLELLPLLRATGTGAAAPARIVNVASLGQEPIDFDDLMIERGYDGMRAYRRSKLAQIMSGFELVERLPSAEVTVNSVHPGTFMPTKMVTSENVTPIDTLETGVESTRRLAVEPSFATVTGRFFDRSRDARANTQAYDPAARAELWERSLKLVDQPDLPN